MRVRAKSERQAISRYLYTVLAIYVCLFFGMQILLSFNRDFIISLFPHELERCYLEDIFQRDSSWVQPFQVVAIVLFTVCFSLHVSPLLADSERVTSQKTLFSYFTGAITGFTVVEYVVMINTLCEICTVGEGFPLFTSHTLLWACTTPILLALLGLFGGPKLPSQYTFFVLFCDFMIFFTGWLIRVYQGDMFWYVVSCLFFFVVLEYLARTFDEAANMVVFQRDRALILNLKVTTIVIWCLFPVIELARMYRVISLEHAEILFILGDIISKGAYSIIVVKGKFFALFEVHNAKNIITEDHYTDSTHSTENMDTAYRILSLAKEEMNFEQNMHRNVIGNVSHELRTPLNSVIGFNEQLLDSVEGTQKQYVQSALSSARRLLGVIDQVLMLSRMQADTDGKHTIGSIDFVETLDETVDIVWAQALKNGVHIVTDLDPRLYRLALQSSSSRLRFILLHLLSNAVNFCDKSRDFRFARVGITLAVPEEVDSTISQTPSAAYPQSGLDLQYVTIFVQDNGVGIARDRLSLIFSPFSALPHSHTELEGRIGSGSGVGVGLGLSLVQKAVNLLGGSVAVESQVGVGSIFRIVLPFVLKSGVGVEGMQPSLGSTFTTSTHVVVLMEERIRIEPLVVQIRDFSVRCIGVACEESTWQEDVVTEVQCCMRSGGQLLVLVDVKTLSQYFYLKGIQILLLPVEVLFILFKGGEELHPDFVSMIGASRIHSELKSPAKIGDLWDALKKISLKRKKDRRFLAMRGESSSDSDSETKILVVEDNELNIKVVSLILSKLEGVVFEVARNGMEALDYLLSGNFYNVILMDIHMPVLDGISATLKIRELESVGKLKSRHFIVAVTAANGDVMKERCLAVGMDKVVEKPVSVRLLTNILQVYRRAKLSQAH